MALCKNVTWMKWAIPRGFLRCFHDRTKFICSCLFFNQALRFTSGLWVFSCSAPTWIATLRYFCAQIGSGALSISAAKASVTHIFSGFSARLCRSEPPPLFPVHAQLSAGVPAASGTQWSGPEHLQTGWVALEDRPGLRRPVASLRRVRRLPPGTLLRHSMFLCWTQRHFCEKHQNHKITKTWKTLRNTKFSITSKHAWKTNIDLKGTKNVAW